MFFTTILPYWFSFMISLACHTFGFLLYAVVTQGWMMIVSRFLTGIFCGLHRALAFAYFAVTYEYYISETQESKKYCRIKDLLFALYTVSTSLGFLVGAGMHYNYNYCCSIIILFSSIIIFLFNIVMVFDIVHAGVSVVFSKFNHIDHFRAIGWYNAALGLAFFVLLVFTFHGEFRRKGRNGCTCTNLKLIRKKGSKLWQKSNIIVLLVSSNTS